MDIRLILLLHTVILLNGLRRVKCQEQDEEYQKTQFLEPNQISELEVAFTRDDKEYLFINYPMDYFAASVICKGNYHGRLAFVATADLASFLAVALSETHLLLDALWIGARLSNRKWYWYEGQTRHDPVSKEIRNLFVNYSQSVKSKHRNCLAMARKNHDTPHFPALKCNVERPIMCERVASNAGNNGSTHPGWITLGKRLYKIFQERASWLEATAKCIIYDRNSRLAVIGNFPDSQALGRYLLIGRQSLENAWIGAKYYHDHYAFSQENLILSNVSDSHNYPPWRHGSIRKTRGCVLLDRHLSNITFFVEARCQRLRPYICYKWDTRKQDDHFTDILIEEFGYRSYMNQLPWDLAQRKCGSYQEKYEAKLAEIRERRILSHLIYVMGENKTTAQHIWLGGILDTKVNKWRWVSDQALVQIKILDWLTNTTYFENVEQYNTCLNMDRENHLKAIHYGAICDYAQNFVCMFPREKLIQLEEDEAANATRYGSRRV